MENLNNLGYKYFLPVIKVERLIQNKIEVKKSPLFSRYIFINLDSDFVSNSWGPIQSTKSVSSLVKFGNMPGRIEDNLVEFMWPREDQEESKIEPFFKIVSEPKNIARPLCWF